MNVGIVISACTYFTLTVGHCHMPMCYWRELVVAHVLGCAL